MTAGPEQDALAAQAQGAGEAAEARHQAEAQAQHQVSDSTQVVEQALTADDIAVTWSTVDTGASPTLVPSEPRPVNSADRDPRQVG
jgi:regulator of protease activity HflC (stomatin/prohibitin superfamily)